MNFLKHLCLAVTVLLLHVAFGQTNSLNPISEKYDALLHEQYKGVGLMVKKNNETQTLSLGEYELNRKSVFNIGSATKTFTAVLILQEVERGNIKLTDSVGAFLSPITNVDSSLTIESLLAHESGLDEVVGRNILDIFYAEDDTAYNINLLEQIEPGNPEKVGSFSYCNTNYLLLGRILEKITDQHYFDLLEQRIFAPLQLANTYSYLHRNIENLAPPTHKGKDVSARINHYFYGNIPGAAGSIASTLDDMNTFYTSLFETETLLKKESLERMLTSGNEVYGLGIFKLNYNDKQYYGHGGNNIGYAFSNAYDPETGELFLMFTNAISMPLNTIEDDVLDYLAGKEISGLKAVNIGHFERYQGSYLIKEAGLELTIEVEGDKIFLIAKAQNIKSELHQKDENTLVEPETGVRLIKIPENPDSLTFSQSGFTTVIHKVKASE